MVRIKTKITSFNAFEEKYFLDNIELNRRRMATRIYLGYMIMSMIVLSAYIINSQQTITNTISFPSLSQYNQIKARHFDTTHCFCSVKSIPRSESIKITPSYHQICSSILIKPFWYKSLQYQRDRVVTTKFTLISSAYFKALDLLCHLAMQTFNESYERFLLTPIISNQLLAQTTFTIEANSSIENFFTTMKVDFRYTIQLVSNFLHSNQYVSAIKSNVGHTIEPRNPSSTANETIPVFFETRRFMNADGERCVCLNGLLCYESADSQGLMHWIPEGIMVGCFVIDTALKSSLACWFDRGCIRRLIQEFEIMGVTVSDADASLNITIPSRFTPDTPFESIFDDLMLESYHVQVSYESYYFSCAPSHCTYTYRTRSDLIFIITTLFGYFGGLNVVFRLVSLLLVRIIYKRSTNQGDKKNVASNCKCLSRVNLTISNRSHSISSQTKPMDDLS